jgi:hypothetical protein
VGRQSIKTVKSLTFHPEDGNCNICRNGKLSTFDAVHPLKAEVVQSINQLMQM